VRSNSFESVGSACSSTFSAFDGTSAVFFFKAFLSPILVFGLEASFGEVSSKSSSAVLRLLRADLASFLSLVFAGFLVISGVKNRI
jgi:hypothetical protein